MEAPGTATETTKDATETTRDAMETTENAMETSENAMETSEDTSEEAPATEHCTLPFSTDETEWLSAALIRKQFCDRHRRDEETAGCNQPRNARATDPRGSKPIHSGQRLRLEGMKDWHLVCAPPSPGTIRTREDLDKSKFEKYAPGRRLTDLGVVFALLTTEAHWRAEHLAFDFDKRGRVRRTRVPRSPTCVIRAHGVNWLPVYHDTYVLTGGYNADGWLLQTSYDDSNKTHWIRTGLVMAPPKIISSPGAAPATPKGVNLNPQGLDTELFTFNPRPLQPEQITNTWEFSYVGRRGDSSGTALKGLPRHEALKTIVWVIETHKRAGITTFGKIPRLTSGCSPTYNEGEPEERQLTGLPASVQTITSAFRPSTKFGQFFTPFMWDNMAKPRARKAHEDVRNRPNKLQKVTATPALAATPATTTQPTNPTPVLSPTSMATLSTPSDTITQPISDVPYSRISTEFQTATAIIAVQGGPTLPDLHQAIARLEARRAIIRNNDAALATVALGQQPTAVVDYYLAWLANLTALPNPAMRSIIQSIHTTNDMNAVSDALLWHQQLGLLQEMIAAHTTDSMELNLYRALLDHLTCNFPGRAHEQDSDNVHDS